MIKASELRLGNYVWNETQQKAVQVDLKILSEQFYCTDPKKAWPPIKLTEEWLLKFGFERSGGLYEKDPLTYLLTHNEALLWGEGSCINIGVIKYVHQLQNLYLSLTGQELTIKNDKG